MGPGTLKLLTLLLLISKVTHIVKGMKLCINFNTDDNIILSWLPTGLVEISPSPVAPVCQAGDQLELRCSVPGVFLSWEFNVPGTQVPFSPVVTAGGSSGVPPPLMVNSTRFTLSRLSTQPLTSGMMINNVSEGLNGVQVNCVDVETSESAATTIRILDVGTRGRQRVVIVKLYMRFAFESE